MRRVLFSSCLLFAALILNACQTTELELKTGTSIVEVTAPVRAIPVDVVSDYIIPQALVPQAISVAEGNLYSNGGFESGLEGWTGCAIDAVKASTDAYEGAGALKVNAGNCFYRSVEVSPGQELVLSCYVKLESGSAWTGMGLGFADSSWSTVGEAGPTIITGSSYARYDVKATAPANSKYASMWLYSDNPVLVDNCSLMLETEPPPPPPPSGENLLENSAFGFRNIGNASQPIRDWGAGCGGSVSAIQIRSPRLDEARGVSVREGACIDQSLSASDVVELQGNDFAFSCFARNSSGYAALSVFVDGNPISKVIPVTENYQIITLQVPAQNFSSAFVSIYGEGSLTIDYCIVSVGSQGIPPFSRILIGSQRRLGQPAGEIVYVRLWNTGNQPLTNINVTSDNIADCNVSVDSLTTSEQYLYECSTGPLEPGETFTTNLTVTAQSPDGQTVTRTTSFVIRSAVGAGNLLENDSFNTIDANGNPLNWTKGCDGSADIVDFGIFSTVLQLSGGACVDQALSADEVIALRGNNYTLQCNVAQTGGYASMSVFFDGVANSQSIPVTTDARGNETVVLRGTAGENITEGFVSFYSEGTTTNNLKLIFCSLRIDLF